MPQRLMILSLVLVLFNCTTPSNPSFQLNPTPRYTFNSFVDCNMAEAWIGDTLRIFPGKYGEDPVWGYSNELEYADGKNPDEVFGRAPEEFTDPIMPPNASPGKDGLHGAVWFETVYQDSNDPSGKTLFALYHNENYPQTLPFDASTGEGYVDRNWPQGLRGPESAAAVCRIGIMKSQNGGRSWENKGIIIQDLQQRMILKTHNTSLTFAGGVGDPSAVASEGYLYVFYGEYGYPGTYDSLHYDPTVEWSGQCISIARISLSDLDDPSGKARRWDGNGFNAPGDSTGAPIKSLQIPPEAGGGAASVAGKLFYWGPSVSWNTHLHCWVMLMGRVEGPSWKGGNLYISFNRNENLGEGNNSQEWSAPQLLVSKPGHTLWYPSLQPMNSEEDIKNKYTCLRLGKKARLFYKDMHGDSSDYISEYIIEFR